MKVPMMGDFLMKKVLYFDCSAGASGDMTLGALLGLGLVDINMFKQELNKLPIKGFEVKTRKVNKMGIEALKVDVVITEEDSPHRGLSDIKKIINASSLNATVKEMSLRIFTNLAEAEAKIHGTTVDKIHFHEVGAIDAIVDIVGVAILFDKLDVDEIYVSNIHTGSGFITCQHGKMPVPAPATLELLKGVPIYATDIKGELITPTGAAILTTVTDEFGKMPVMRVERIGYGAGTKDLQIPNVLRVSLGSIKENTLPSGLITAKEWMLECNIDDMNNELIDYVMEKLFQAGAKDVYITPIQMKKNRPAIKLSILFPKEIEDRILRIVFKETTSIGVRTYPIEKIMLQRKTQEIDTPWGKVKVKIAYFGGEIINVSPEYDDCKKIAVQTGLPLKEIYYEVQSNFIK